MTKNDFKILMEELRAGISYSDVDINPLFGCALEDFPKRKMVRKEVIIQHMRWQCLQMDGNINEEELENTIEILRNKKVIMI